MPSNTISITGSNVTPTTISDRSKPAPMKDAETIYNKLLVGANKNGYNALVLTEIISAQIISTPYHELDSLWPKVEKNINNGRAIAIKATTPAGQLETTLGFLYESLNTIDKEDNINNLAIFRNLFYDTASYLDKHVLHHLDSKDQNITARILTIIENRMDKVVKRFNDRVDKQEINGYKIT